MVSIRPLRNIISLYAFIFVVWGFYRLIFRFPPEVEELILKPIVWLGPLWFILLKEGLASPAVALKSVGWTKKNIFKSIYLAIGLGILFAVEGGIVNSIKYGGSFNFINLNLAPSVFLGALGLSLATAISEETVFRGFIFGRLSRLLGEWKASLATSIGWAAVHLPIVIFVFKYDVPQTLSFLFLTFLFGIASAFVYARTGNILSSVLLHVFWEWPIILFR